jgi:sulfatase maturation enzyme AslB (radical SAM superfamily)
MDTAIVTADAKSHAEPGALDFLWLELTNQCNLKCLHCYSESSPVSTERDILGESDYATLLEEAFELGCRRVQFIGGEPTLNRRLPSLIARASQLGYRIEVFTNLLHLGDELLRTFVQYRVAIATSMYADTSDVHDLITQTPGSHKRTIANIERLLESGLQVRAGVIAMGENSKALDSTFSMLRALGVVDINLDHVREFGRGNTGRSCSMEKLCGNCANNILAVGPDGLVAPCIMSKQWSVGSVLSTSLKQIAVSEDLFEVRRSIAAATAKAWSDSRGIDSSTGRSVSLPTMCEPYGSPNPCSPDSSCMPNCSPSYNCTPCSPNSSQPCQPNRWCDPSQR